MMNNFDIGNRLRYLRKKNRMTQEELSKILCCSKGYLSKIEKGDASINTSVLMKYNTYFKVEMEWVLFGSSKEGSLQDFPINFIIGITEIIIKRFPDLGGASLVKKVEEILKTVKTSISTDDYDAILSFVRVILDDDKINKILKN